MLLNFSWNIHHLFFIFVGFCYFLPFFILQTNVFVWQNYNNEKFYSCKYANVWGAWNLTGWLNAFGSFPISASKQLSAFTKQHYFKHVKISSWLSLSYEKQIFWCWVQKYPLIIMVVRKPVKTLKTFSTEALPFVSFNFNYFFIRTIDKRYFSFYQKLNMKTNSF